jgi:integrase
LGKLNKTTAGKYERTRDLVIAMQDYYNKRYKVKDVGVDFIEKFELFAFDIKNFAKNYVGRIIKFIKTVVRDARVSGIETHPQLDSIKGYTTKTSFVVLTEEEISKIKVVTLPINHKINDARDWLLISCYTGQRVSDFLRFNSNMIIEVNNATSGKTIKMINFIQEKTKKEIDFPISTNIAEILDKRGGEFPAKMTSQEYNKLIKEVCKIAGLVQIVYGGKEKPETKRKEWGSFPKYELITSHIGRRTFCSIQYGKIPTPFIMYASGHSTETMLLKYINKTNTQNSLELAKYLN